MNKLLLALTLVLAPFFSLSQTSSNIFENGTVDLKEPKTESVYTFDCTTTGVLLALSIEGQIPSDITSVHYACASAAAEPALAFWKSQGNNGYQHGSCVWTATPISVDVGGARISILKSCPNRYDEGASLSVLASAIVQSETKTCPPDGFPQHTSEYSFNSVQKCYDPAQASLEDSCKVGSSNEFLSIGVTVASGCFSQPDGSSCKYNAVDAGGGNEYYAMDLEGDCYSEELPDLEGTPQDTPSSSDDTCSDWGGTGMICPENPDDVCDSSGQCQEGCGTLNGVFTCIDNDLDGDDIPDYLDPDIDGDGIPNEDDLDNDGDGKDDPIDNSGGGNQGGGGEPIDLSPVVNKLEEIKKSISETSKTRNTEPTPELVGFYESEYEDGIEGMFEGQIDEYKSTEFYLFLNEFKPNFSGTPPNLGFCMNFGNYMNLGCFNFELDPRLFPALKIFILITAAFTCRKILFGG